MSHSYLKRWTAFLDCLSPFSWTMLTKKPEWSEIESSMQSMIEKGLFDSDKSSQLFEQFGHVNAFITAEKIGEWVWVQNKTACEDRWVECFKHFEANGIVFTEISLIVEYIFCLPATSAPVERVFSHIDKMWSSEKTRLAMKTLKAMLYTKYNLKFSCLEFYEFLKSKPHLLRKIISSEKYVNNFNAEEPTPSTSTE